MSKWGVWVCACVLLAACGDDDADARSDAGEGRGGRPGVLPPEESDARVPGEGAASERCKDDLDCEDSTHGRARCDRVHAGCVECLLDSDCGGAERCVVHQCIVPRTCKDSLDCELGTVCDPSTDECVECLSTADCGDGFACAESRCEPGCDSDKDCTRFGLLCDDAAGRCRLPERDAGAPVMPAPDATVPDPTQCATTLIPATQVLATIMFVVDGSGSMESGYGPVPDGGMPLPMMAVPGQASRWTAVRDALAKPGTGVVSALDGRARFGLAVFGTAPTCPLPIPIVEPAVGNAAAIAAAMPAAPPGMFTPTGPALDQVIDLLPDTTVTPGGPQIIVLATDGEPNSCGSTDIFGGFPVTDYAPSLAAAMKARAKHIPIYVISVAEASGEFANHLQQMANLGADLAADASPGATVYYPEAPDALVATLGQLISAQLPCELELARGVKAGLECQGTIALNGAPLECNGANGWQLVDPTHVRLSGAACASLRNGPVQVTAQFPCSAQQ